MPQQPATSFDDDLKSVRSDFESDLSAARQSAKDGKHVEPGLVSRLLDWLPTVGGAAGGIIGGIGGTVGGVGVGGVPGAVGGAALGGAAGEALSQIGHRVMGDKAPGSASDAAKGIAGQAAMQGGAELVGGTLVKGAAKAAPALMTSAVKPAYKTVEKAVKSVEMPRVVKTLLDEGVNVTQGGIGKINSLLSATNAQIDDIIRNSTATVDPADVLKPAGDVMRRVSGQVSPSADIAAVRGVVDDFAANAGAGPIPVQAAQRLKTGTYRALSQRAYGETKGAAVETEKALARGLKEGIEKAHPEVQGLNAREGGLIEARDAIAKRVAQAANRDPAGLGWIAENPKSFMAFVMSRSPAVKSMLARGLYQSASHASKVPENLIRLGMQALATTGDVE